MSRPDTRFRPHEAATQRLAPPPFRAVSACTPSSPQFLRPRTLDELAELRNTVMDERYLNIGASVSLADAFATLRADDANWQALAEHFASPMARMAGSLGRNVANGFALADALPALIALGSRIVLQKGASLRELALEDFHLGAHTTALASDEFVRSVRVPRADAERIFRNWKISRTQDQGSAAVCAGFMLRLGDAGRISEARLAFSGLAPTPRRARAAEAALRGQALELRSIEAAMHALEQDFQATDALPACANHCLQMARNLLRRLWLEQSQPSLRRVAPHSA